jgi:integrase
MREIEIAQQETRVLSEELLTLAEGVGRSIQESRSANTNRALRARWAAFCRWAEPRGFSTLPAEPFVVSLYAEALDSEGKLLSTILAYISAIATIHRDRGLDSPCDNQGVREYLAGKRRQHASRTQRQAIALSDEDVQTVLVSLYRRRKGRGGHIETQEHADVRAAIDASLLLTMTQAGLRRSEAAVLTWGDVGEYVDGTGRILIVSSKTDQTGKGVVVAVKRDCIRALLAIKPKDAAPEDSVFNLSGSQIARRLKAMCEAAGLDSERISGHTPRVSLARGMSERGAPTHLIQRQGRWASPSMVLSYTREAAAAETLNWL